MDEKRLSINEVQRVMGWSYPTALKFAQINGQMIDVGVAGGQWFVPVEVVQKKVEDLFDAATGAQAALNGIVEKDLLP